MKKITLSLAAFALLLLVFGSYNTANATVSAEEEGCQSGWAFNPFTGMPCSAPTLPPGCLPGYIFSYISGQRCAPYPVPMPTPVPPFPMPSPIPPTPVNPIVIEGVSGPQKLDVGQKGTWKVKAHDEEGQDLSYSVKWGDEYVNVIFNDNMAAVPAYLVQQSATFTHTYTHAGTYYPNFTVSNDYGSENTSLSVNVGNTTKVKIACPSFPCFFDGKAITNNWASVDTPPSHVSAGYPYEFTLKSPASVQMTLRSNVWPADPDAKNTMFVELDDKIIFRESKTYEQFIADEQSDDTTDIIQLGKLSTGRHEIKIYASPDPRHFHFDWFKLDSSGSSSSVTVLSPNGGETWQKGTTQTIKWRDTNDISTHEINMIGLDPYTGKRNSYYTIANTQGSSYNWPVGKTLDGSVVVDGSYILQICQSSNHTVCDESDSYFKIVSGTTTNPVITVLSPNGGETWQKGTTQTIKWQDAGPTPVCAPERYCQSPVYDITLDSGTMSREIANDVSGAYYKWTIPNCYSGNECSSNFDVPTGSYKMRVCRSDGSYCDTSDSYFKITSGTTTQPLTLSAERHSASPYGYINSGSNVELLRFNLSAKGQDAIIQKFNLEPVGPAVAHVSNISAYVNGNYIGKLSDLTNTSSWYYKGVINISDANGLGGLGMSQDDVVEISIRGDVSSSSAAANAWMWINLTGIRTDPTTPAASVFGLPVYGHQINISTGPTITPPHEDPVVLGAESFTFTQKLEMGMEGNEVGELQKYLAAKGYYSGDIDGKFGLNTEKALVSFQITNGLKVDGIVGTATRGILNQ